MRFPPPNAQLLWGLAAALLIGTLVGIEREKSKGLAGKIGIGGVRTFILFSLTGAVAAWLSQLLGSPLVFAVAIAGVSALVVAGHVVQARTKPDAIGLTTEAAALGVCLLGGACVAGYPEIALALGIATSAVLAYKQPLHELVGRLGTEDIDAGVKLLVATFIVLPLLPREALDPLGAIRPYSLWQLVILVASLSLVGYVATRALGPQRGTAVTGLAGGLVSSTAVTLAFARRSREEGGKTDEALAAGVLLAWGVMFGKVVIEVAVVHPPLVAPLLVPFGAMAAATAVLAGLHASRADSAVVAGEVPLRNPFSLTAAVRFALFFAAVLVVVKLVQRWVPGQGFNAVAALARLTDVDAITLSMASLARDGGCDARTAVGSIVVAALTNTLVKCGMLLALASVALRLRAAMGTAVILVAGLAAAFLG
ncbi:MAG: hypothetical protein A2V74_07950 [Acidobacteria bacterium RBG_16_70_10]|nr:MAG: hypothetical protein A2V74_07950 [Acidobacteria bacterium RBG_16_70_10]